jgi:putative MATE family efflux protein
LTDAKFQQMTGSPVEKLIIQMALPTITIMLVSAMYNIADTYFVSFLGVNATAALGVVFSLMAVLQAAGFFFGNGAGNYIARSLGARNNSAALKMAATGFFTALGFGLLIALTGSVYLAPLARLLGATETILPYTVEYLRYILLGAPFMVCAFMLNNCLRFQGNTFWSMVGMVSGAALNVALDPLFIFVFRLGVSGAALATMLSQLFSFVLLLWLACNVRHNVPIRPGEFTPGLRVYKEIIRGGSPSLLRQSLLSISTIFINHAAGNFGDAAIAAISIVSRIIQIMGAALLGLGQGFQPVCGFNYGAGNYIRVKQAYGFCLRVSTILLTALSFSCFVAAKPIILLFRIADPAVTDIGALTLRLQCLTFPLAGRIIIDNMFLQTIGKTLPASLVAVSRQGLFLLPLLFVLTRWQGLRGLQLSIPAADICAFVLSVYLSGWAVKKYLK